MYCHAFQSQNRIYVCKGIVQTEQKEALTFRADAVLVLWWDDIGATVTTGTLAAEAEVGGVPIPTSPIPPDDVDDFRLEGLLGS
jgi:hypothetical protein